MSSLINLEKLVAVCASSILLAHFGRKTLLQVGTLLAAISCTMSGVGFLIQNDYYGVSEKLIVLGCFCFMGVFGLFLGPVIWLYIPEIVEPSTVALTTAANWVSASLLLILFPILTEHVL